MPALHGCCLAALLLLLPVRAAAQCDCGPAAADEAWRALRAVVAGSGPPVGLERSDRSAVPRALWIRAGVGQRDEDFRAPRSALGVGASFGLLGRPAHLDLLTQLDREWSATLAQTALVGEWVFRPLERAVGRGSTALVELRPSAGVTLQGPLTSTLALRMPIALRVPVRGRVVVPFVAPAVGRTAVPAADLIVSTGAVGVTVTNVARSRALSIAYVQTSFGNRPGLLGLSLSRLTPR